MLTDGQCGLVPSNFVAQLYGMCTVQLLHLAVIGDTPGCIKITTVLWNWTETAISYH